MTDVEREQHSAMREKGICGVRKEKPVGIINRDVYWRPSGRSGSVISADVKVVPSPDSSPMQIIFAYHCRRLL